MRNKKITNKATVVLLAISMVMMSFIYSYCNETLVQTHTTNSVAAFTL